MQRSTQRVNKTDWFFLVVSLTCLSGNYNTLNARLAIRQRADRFEANIFNIGNIGFK